MTSAFTWFLYFGAYKKNEVPTWNMFGNFQAYKSRRVGHEEGGKARVPVEKTPDYNNSVS